jgi:hypothetical protein
MLQPFERFKPMYLSKLLEMKKYWLVSQTYHRYAGHSSEEPKESLLLTDYADESMAKTHANALHGDKYAAVLHLQHPPHKAKLMELLGETSRFHVFWAVVKSLHELEEKINAVYKPNMKSFIEKNTNWRISRETTLRPYLELVFGELFVILKYGNQTIRVKFEDIETT